MLVHVTHIDDSVRGRQGPCVYFWGITHDRSLYLLMEKYLECIRHYLEAKPPPPLNLNLLDRVCCVLINHQWHRARVPQPELSHEGTIDVICIDSGVIHAVPLALVRNLDFPGIEAKHVREWPPLATKYMLADVVAPKGRKSASHWSEPAMQFLKVHVENRDWKAEPMGMYGEYQVVRLLDGKNQLLATIMIQQGLGVAAQTYHEAVSMCETMDKQPAFMKPALNAFPDVTSTDLVRSSSGAFQVCTVKVFAPKTKQDCPSTSTMPDADIRVKVSCVVERQVSKDLIVFL
jgi:tudor domain-containing protein 1/4/6/7